MSSVSDLFLDIISKSYPDNYTGFTVSLFVFHFNYLELKHYDK